MDRWLLALTVPFFFLLIGVEWWVARRRGQRVYRFQDGIASLSTGVLQQTADFGLTVWTLGSYVYIYEHYRLGELAMDSAWQWVAAALGVDFLYYWFHRASHRINLLWAAHVVHHQSEEYNLTTALRQSTLQPVFNAVFYWPLALLGLPPMAAVLLFTLDVLYQFWIHSRLIPALGPLEYVLCTPSNHRVHHGIDPEYIDRNYGGVLIIWDRLFGTYRAEGREPNYGTVTPLSSWNPLWANLAYFKTIGERMRAARGPAEKLKAWLAPPEWRPASEGGTVIVPAVERATRALYQPVSQRARNRYVMVQYVWVVAVLFSLMLKGPELPSSQLIMLGAWIAASAAAWAGLFEWRAWAPYVEGARLLGAAALGFWVLGAGHLEIAILNALVVTGMLVWLLRLPGLDPRTTATPPKIYQHTVSRAQV